MKNTNSSERYLRSQIPQTKQKQTRGMALQKIPILAKPPKINTHSMALWRNFIHPLRSYLCDDGDVWVSIVSYNSDLFFASVTAVLYTMSYNAASCYNGTGL